MGLGIKRRLKPLVMPAYYKWFIVPKLLRSQNKRLEIIRDRGYANVVFFASSIAMWHYQGIYDFLSKDRRFKTNIILQPFKTFSGEQRSKNIAELRHYFDSKSMAYTDATEWKDTDFNIDNTICPDILFYPQPYDSLFGNTLDFNYYKDRLLCYAPYGTITVSTKWLFNNKYQNIAWKLFYDSDIILNDAKRLAYNKAFNAIAIGNADADEFLRNEHKDVWKPQSIKKKRIIWAPHFSFAPDEVMHRGSFLWLWKFMLDIATEYSDRVQFAFKPHPRLKTELYKYPGWGKERTDEYYNKWANMSNTQFEDSDYKDLFMTSDAMIHDSGSFTAEYHFSRNPVMFTTQNLERTMKPLNEIGRAALKAHYIGKSTDDVKRFIDNVVLGGNDSMYDIRDSFFRKYLLPPNGKSVAENMYDEIVKSIWG